MPELPEVETTCRGLRAKLPGQRITAVDVRQGKLRYPIPADFAAQLTGQTVTAITRRSKYALLHLSGGNTLLVHLGMSGRLTFQPATSPPLKHDHVLLRFEDAQELRYFDPRRFGFMDIVPTADLPTSRYLAHLGPEPLEEDFTPAWLYQQLHRRSTPVKVALMDAAVVVGVGNIYANEALFRAGIRPTIAAKRLTKPACARLVQTVQEVLTAAIAAGGTTLRDYQQTDGALGYFFNDFNVYGRAGARCLVCQTPIKRVVLAQRATFYCPCCQK